MEIKVMSFNIRMDTPHDGINAFSKRYPRTLEVIDKEKPDVIGFQEVTDSMREILRKNLKGYTIVGCGRDWNYLGEGTLIAFREDDWEMINYETIWLSETPHTPGTHFGGAHSGCPRILNSVLLKHHNSSTPYTFISTHLDHEGGRDVEAKMLCDYMSKIPHPIILMGDMNAVPKDDEIAILREFFEARGGEDCTHELGPTFHNYGRLDKDRSVKIDYIFADKKASNAFIVEDIPVNGQYYSDHNAVCATIEI